MPKLSSSKHSSRQRPANPSASRERPDVIAAQKVLAEIWPGGARASSVELLKALHVLTRDGGLNLDSRRKLKQVLHLVQLLRPSLDALLAERPDAIVADLGAGKSYLGFLLYDLVVGPAGHGALVGVEVRAELVERAQALAKACGFDRLSFVAGEIAGATLPGGRADMVTALHACDTATDDAIRFALRHQAKVIALIPCCQAEVASLLEGAKPAPIDQLWRHPMHRREFGAHATNVLRALVLEAHGYKVRVTEFTGLEHSLKNELILATRHQQSNPLARRKLDQLVEQLGVRPRLLDVMDAA
ncbi:SAM-dependent methyltransferase [uncultured Reyranella sp.]|uniref:class I SAM-dependent methyltransferase n=1 Tax=uncultured Reyranella sp. TaxID=735512 RepID=UPI00259CB4C8|nr:SAM-dependent methyltransferase [uncultured Reyranella sp.]